MISVGANPSYPKGPSALEGPSCPRLPYLEFLLPQSSSFVQATHTYALTRWRVVWFYPIFSMFYSMFAPCFPLSLLLWPKRIALCMSAPTFTREHGDHKVAMRDRRSMHVTTDLTYLTFRDHLHNVVGQCPNLLNGNLIENVPGSCLIRQSRTKQDKARQY